MTILGLLAAALTTACWVPQVVRSWRTRSTGDLSWAYLVVFGLGVAMWLAYGLGRHDPAIIAANGLTLASLLALVGLKIRASAAVGRPRCARRPARPAELR